ncbi:MAG: hypothetical protein NTW19_10415 [Planctomycetota bacterium]|nr:hypothetical protein [Planctomycetota bacterium]
MTRIRLLLLGASIAWLVAPLAGCDEEKPKVTYVSKEETQADTKAAEQFGPGMGMPAAGAQGAPGIAAGPASGVALQWAVPKGWTRQPDAPMRYATFKFGPEGAQGEVTVSSLPPGASDVLRNVRRWRGQLGLPDAPDTEVMKGVSEPMKVDDAETRLVEILGPENPVAPPATTMPGSAPPPAAPAASPAKPLARQRMLTAILSRPSEVWFFKLVGPEAMVEEQKKTFVDFVLSVKFVAQEGEAASAGNAPGSVPGMAPGMGPVGSTDPHAGIDPHAAPPLLPLAAPPAARGTGPAPGVDGWEVPVAWKVVPNGGPFRVAAFRVGGNKPVESAEIVITSFSGGVGSLLDNINRWRGQVGLEPVADPKDQPAEALAKNADPAVVFDIVGPASQPPEKRHIVVAMIIHGEQSWFVKMTGGQEVVAAQKPTFTTFVRSLRFSNASNGGGGG